MNCSFVIALTAASLLITAPLSAAEGKDSVLVERNLFAPDRIPPAPDEGPITSRSGPSQALFQLDAVIIQAGERLALLSYIDMNNGKSSGKPVRRIWVRPRQRLDTGHVVESIEPERVSLSRAGENLELPLHGNKQFAPPVQNLPTSAAANNKAKQTAPKTPSQPAKKD